MNLRASLFASTLAALALVASAAPAQTAAIQFDVVTSYLIQANPNYPTNPPFLQVVGVEHGQTASSTRIFTSSYAPIEEACERAVIQMINRPGRFMLEVLPQQTSGTTNYIYHCALIAK